MFIGFAFIDKVSYVKWIFKYILNLCPADFLFTRHILEDNPKVLARLVMSCKVRPPLAYSSKSLLTFGALSSSITMSAGVVLVLDIFK